MSGFKIVMLAAVAGVILMAAPFKATAQIKVEIGVAPDCPYGYYDYAPYTCVPDGYYGPEWFTGGVFIGVGPWFHGDEHFRGNVDNTYDPQHGYNGPAPSLARRLRHNAKILGSSRGMNRGMDAGIRAGIRSKAD